MKKLASLIGLFAFASYAQVNNSIVSKKDVSEKGFMEVLASKLSFNYYIKYLGPSLSNNMQNGSTFNRFETGQDFKGEDLDFKGSLQTFQSLRLGYRLSSGSVISYGLSFQDNLRKDIQSSDGIRDYGRSFNNQRASIWVPSIINNSIFYVSSSFYYELPTTKTSIENEMLYGVGIQPQLGFYSPIAGLYYGIASSIERDVYPDDEFLPSWCSQENTDCENVYSIKRQTLRASISPYLNYYLTDSVSLRSQLSFDWDQDGNQIGTNEFNKNLDDIWSLSLAYSVMQSLMVSGGLEGSLNVPHIDRTAMFASLNLSI